MSLVVVGVTDCTVWMLSDTAITGPKIELSERQYLPKIEPSNSASHIGQHRLGSAGGRSARRAARGPRCCLRGIRGLGANWKDAVVVAVTEFGRTARINATKPLAFDFGDSASETLAACLARPSRLWVF